MKNRDTFYHYIEKLGGICLQDPIFKSDEVTEREFSHTQMDIWIFFSRKESKDHPETFFTNGYVITDDNIFDEINKN